MVISCLMYLCPVIVCKNQGCESQPVRLPYPNPPHSSELRPDWPNADWKPFIACFECGHSYLYTADDVHWGAFETEELGRKQAWVKYALQCAASDCGLPIEFYVCAVRVIEPEALWERLYAAKQRPTCEKDHSLTRDSLRISATTVDQLSPLQRMRQAS